MREHSSSSSCVVGAVACAEGGESSWKREAPRSSVRIQASGSSSATIQIQAASRRRVPGGNSRLRSGVAANDRIAGAGKGRLVGEG